MINFSRYLNKYLEKFKNPVNNILFMITRILAVAIIVFLGTISKEETSLVIDMQHEYNEEIPMREYPIEMHLKTLDQYPKFKREITETYKNIPTNDSIHFYYRQSSNNAFDIYKSGDLSKEEFVKRLNNMRIDSTKLFSLKFPDNLVFAVGFKNNKQFIIADANRNKDFIDDIKYEFDYDPKSNSLKEQVELKNLPTSNYKYEVISKGKTQEFNRKFILYPDKNNTYSLINGKNERSFFTIFRFKDFWKGNFTIDKQKIEFYYYGVENKYGNLYIKPKDISFNFTDKYSNVQFMHELTDTIPIGKGYYVVDSINSNISKLYLRKIVRKTDLASNTTGTYIKNTEFKDLENKPFNTQDILSQKKYTLLEFWGTWCEPCRKLTPKIKNISKTFSSKLSIISIAIDDNKDAVKKYVSKNEMNWKNGYISQKDASRTMVLKQFNIQYFPTYFLLDSNGKIIYRGSSDNFEEILKLIK